MLIICYNKKYRPLCYQSVHNKIICSECFPIVKNRQLSYFTLNRKRFWVPSKKAAKCIKEMVSTIEIKPALILRPFISCYALREFDTGGMIMPKPLHAVHEYYMTFFLKDKFCDLIDSSGKIQPRISSTLITFLTTPTVGVQISPRLGQSSVTSPMTPWTRAYADCSSGTRRTLR